MDQQKVTMAIDVGCGYTKWAVQREGAPPRHECFPSATPLCLNALDRAPDTLQVSVEGVRYCLGPGSFGACVMPHEERDATMSFYRSRKCQALHHAALARANEPVIDHLVVGVPQVLYRGLAQPLRRQYEGEVVIDLVDRPPMRVLVRQVTVVTPTIGVWRAATREQPQLQETRPLVVDLGFASLDYLRPWGPRDPAGTVGGGMYWYYNALQKQVDAAATLKGWETKAEFLPRRLEEAIAHGWQLSVGPHEFDLSNFRCQADAVLDGYVSAVATRIGGVSGITSVVMAGGGARMLAQRFKARHPTAPQPYVPVQAQQAALNGYLLIAQDQPSPRSAPAGRPQRNALPSSASEMFFTDKNGAQ